MGKLGATLALILAMTLLTRMLSPEEFGAFSLTFSFVMIAATLAQLGLSQAVVRLVAKARSDDNWILIQYWISRIILYGAFGGLAVGAAIVGGVGEWVATSVLGSKSMASVTWLAAIWVFFKAFQSLLAETFRGLQDMATATIVAGFGPNAIMATSFAAISVLGIRTGLDDILTIAILACAIVSVCVLPVLLYRVGSLRLVGSVWNQEILRIAAPLLLTNTTLMMLTQADIWILGAYHSSEDVAIFASAAKLVVIVAMPLTVMNGVLAPIIAELYYQSRQRQLEKLLGAIAALGAIVAVPIGILFILFGNDVMRFIFGQFYESGGRILAILTLGQLANVLAGSCGLVLMMTGCQVGMMRITLVTGVLAVVGCLAVVQPYGAIGVATVTAITMVLQNVMMLLYTRFARRIWTCVRAFPRFGDFQ